MGLPLTNLSGEPSDGPTEAKLNQKGVEEIQEQSKVGWFRKVLGLELFRSWDLGKFR